MEGWVSVVWKEVEENKQEGRKYKVTWGKGGRLIRGFMWCFLISTKAGQKLGGGITTTEVEYTKSVWALRPSPLCCILSCSCCSCKWTRDKPCFVDCTSWNYLGNRLWPLAIWVLGYLVSPRELLHYFVLPGRQYSLVYLTEYLGLSYIQRITLAKSAGSTNCKSISWRRRCEVADEAHREMQRLWGGSAKGLRWLSVSELLLAKTSEERVAYT